MSERPFSGTEPGVALEVRAAFHDEAGVMLFEEVEQDGRRWVRRPDGNGGYVANAEGVRRVLWNLPALRVHLAGGRRAGPVYVTEGTSDARALEAHLGAEGLPGVVTTNPFGALAWPPEYTEALTGAPEVIAIVDNDDAGRKRAALLERELEPVVEALRVLRTPLDHKGSDLRDHLAASLGLDELVALEAPAPDGPPAAAPLAIVAWEDFVRKDEPSARPLLGTEEENVLPADGLLVCYGDGGAGKTSWSVDAFVHLAAGLAWQGHEVARPLRILVIENEGPRGPFRRKLREKEVAWDGPPFRHNIFVLEEPWARVTFAAPGLRAGLAAFASEHEIDLLGAGPVSSLGFEGGGTLEEVAAFAGLLTLLRAELPRPLAAWLVHHENKAGDISGAWEGQPDTLVHLRKDGRERTVCHWSKTRWAPSVHGRSEVLRWLEGERYEVVDGGGQADDEQRAAARAECLAWIVRRAEEQHDADGSSIAKEATAEAYHQAHDDKGRNLARGVFEELLAAWDAYSGGEESGEEEPLLARGPGDRKGGKYLIPARHAPSPLAATSSGDRGDEGRQPPEEAPPRHLAVRPKDGEEAWRGGSGGGDEIPGESAGDPEVEQAERLLERHADLAGEGGPS